MTEGTESSLETQKCGPQRETSESTVSDDEQNDNDDTNSMNDDTSPRTAEQQVVNIKVKAGQTVKYINTDTVDLCVAEVFGRAGKATGKNKNWFNLRYSAPAVLNGAEASVDLSKVDAFECVENSVPVPCEDSNNPGENVMVFEDISFAAAKSAELCSWKKNQVYVEIKDDGQKCISTRWICSLKETTDGIIPKARLVARGFEELETRNLPKDSPTCATESLRLVLVVLAERRWKPHSMDIKTAFLQGSELSRDVFIRPPGEAKAKGIVWQLRKCVYGLADASLYWYNKVREVMLQCGAKISQVDPAVFYWENDQGVVQGILACHVDDFIWGGTAEFEQDIIGTIRSSFRVGQEHGEENETFSYIGIELSSSEEGINLQQQDYLNNLNQIPLNKSRLLQRHSALTKSELEAYRSKVGQILWIARQTRPDVMFDASNLAASMKSATVQNLIEANKVIRKLKSEEVTLKFQFLGDESTLELVIFSDVSLGNLPDGGTQGGHFIMIMGENGRFSPLAWQSKRIRRVVRSTLAGEALALADGIDSGIFLATFFAELTTGHAEPELLPIRCVTDNHSLYDAVRSTKFVADKRLRLEISSIKELIQRRQIKHVQWFTTRGQIADCLTKKGASAFGLLKAISDGMWQETNL